MNTLLANAATVCRKLDDVWKSVYGNKWHLSQQKKTQIVQKTMPGNKCCKTIIVLQSRREDESDSAETTLLVRLFRIRDTAAEKTLSLTVDSLTFDITSWSLSVNGAQCSPTGTSAARSSGTKCRCTMSRKKHWNFVLHTFCSECRTWSIVHVYIIKLYSFFVIGVVGNLKI